MCSFITDLRSPGLGSHKDQAQPRHVGPPGVSGNGNFDKVGYAVYHHHPLVTKWPLLSIDKFVGWKRFNFDKDKFGEGF